MQNSHNRGVLVQKSHNQQKKSTKRKPFGVLGSRSQLYELANTPSKLRHLPFTTLRVSEHHRVHKPCRYGRCSRPTLRTLRTLLALYEVRKCYRIWTTSFVEVLTLRGLPVRVSRCVSLRSTTGEPRTGMVTPCKSREITINAPVSPFTSHGCIILRDHKLPMIRVCTHSTALRRQFPSNTYLYPAPQRRMPDFFLHNRDEQKTPRLSWIDNRVHQTV